MIILRPLVISSDHVISFFVRKCVGSAMDLVTAMEMIDAPTAMAEGGKSKSYPLHHIDL